LPEKYKEPQNKEIRMDITTNSAIAETTGSSWKWIYKLGAIAALAAMLANLLDVLLGFGGTEMVTYGSKSAIEWFAVCQENWFRGVYALGILNIVYMAACCRSISPCSAHIFRNTPWLVH